MRVEPGPARARPVLIAPIGGDGDDHQIAAEVLAQHLRDLMAVEVRVQPNVEEDDMRPQGLRGVPGLPGVGAVFALMAYDGQQLAIAARRIRMVIYNENSADAVFRIH